MPIQTNMLSIPGNEKASKSNNPEPLVQMKNLRCVCSNNLQYNAIRTITGIQAFKLAVRFA